MTDFELGFAVARERAEHIALAQEYYPDTNVGMRQQWVKEQIAAKIHALLPASVSKRKAGR